MGMEVLGEIVTVPSRTGLHPHDFIEKVWRKLAELGCTYDDRRTGSRGYHRISGEGYIEPEYPGTAASDRFHLAIAACQRAGHGAMYLEFVHDEDDIGGGEFGVGCAERIWRVDVQFSSGEYFFLSENSRHLTDFAARILVPLYEAVGGLYAYLTTEDIGRQFLTAGRALTWDNYSLDQESVMPLGFANIVHEALAENLVRSLTMRSFLKSSRLNDGSLLYYLNAHEDVSSYEGWQTANKNILDSFGPVRSDT